MWLLSVGTKGLGVKGRGTRISSFPVYCHLKNSEVIAQNNLVELLIITKEILSPVAPSAGENVSVTLAWWTWSITNEPQVKPKVPRLKADRVRPKLKDIGCKQHVMSFGDDCLFPTKLLTEGPK